MSNKVSVLVAGSWGTALATVLADNGHQVLLWSRNEEQVREINEHNRNSRFLQDVELSPLIVATNSLQEAVEGQMRSLWSSLHPECVRLHPTCVPFEKGCFANPCNQRV